MTVSNDSMTKREREEALSGRPAGLEAEDGPVSDRTGPAGPGRRLGVCFVSVHAYGVLRPSSRVTFGGAEVQISCLARELARDPRFDVTVLTGDGHRRAREHDGDLTILVHPTCGTNQSGGEGRVGQGSGAPRGTGVFVGAWLIKQAYGGLFRCPEKVADAIRAVVRGAYSCRRWLASLRGLRWLAQRLRQVRQVMRWVLVFGEIRADVYVTRCAWDQVGYMQLACVLLRRKFAYMVAHEQDVSGQYVRLNGAYGARFERGLKRADAIVCQHADQVDMVRSRYHRDARLVRSLCPAPVRTRAQETRTTVLWVARVDSWKQPEFFLDLAERLPKLRFVMVGPPSQMNPENFSRLQSRAGTLPNLRFQDRIPFDDTLALFEDALVFVNTSRAEGFPNTFLQAAACGTPIVSWAVNPEGVLDRYRIGFCANGDRSRLELLVAQLCDDAALRRQIGANGRRYVQELHDPAALAKEFGGLCLEICGKRAESPSSPAVPVAESSGA